MINGLVGGCPKAEGTSGHGKILARSQDPWRKAPGREEVRCALGGRFLRTEDIKLELQGSSEVSPGDTELRIISFLPWWAGSGSLVYLQKPHFFLDF